MKQIRSTFVASFLLIILGVLMILQSSYVKSANKAEGATDSKEANAPASTDTHTQSAFPEGRDGTVEKDLMAAEVAESSTGMSPITGFVLNGNPRQTALTGEAVPKPQPEAQIRAAGGGENPIVNPISKENETDDTAKDVLSALGHNPGELSETITEPPITVEPVRLTAPLVEIEASNWLEYGDENGEREDPVLFIWPAVEKWLSGYNFSYAHPGIDIAAVGDDLVFAAASGKVVEVHHSNYGYGNMVIIDHLNGYQTLYGHMSLILAETGNFVIQGQPIGLAGSTGNSTGTHLHFEIHNHGRFVNPWLFLTR